MQQIVAFLWICGNFLASSGSISECTGGFSCRKTHVVVFFSDSPPEKPTPEASWHLPVPYLDVQTDFLAEKHTSWVFSLILRRKNTLRKLPGISRFYIWVYGRIFLPKNPCRGFSNYYCNVISANHRIITDSRTDRRAKARKDSPIQPGSLYKNTHIVSCCFRASATHSPQDAQRCLL